MEIDLYGDPPTNREIEAARAELENSRLLIVQNDAYVAELYHKLLIKTIIIVVILVIVGILYFILPVGMFGVANGRTILLVTVSIMLLSSLLWIGWRTWSDARSIVPSRGHSVVRMREVSQRVARLEDVDVKLRMNVVNWGRSDGILAVYLKKIGHQHRHIIAIEYIAIRKYAEERMTRKTAS